MAHEGVIDHQQVYTPAQVAERLQVSLVWVMRALKAGRLTGFRVGRLWRVREVDIQAFIEAHRSNGIGEESA
jgi:excisionase family DNA binding protein